MIELEQRLRNYREALDDAVAERLAETRTMSPLPVEAARDHDDLRRANRAWLLVAAAVTLLLTGFVVVAQRQPGSPTDEPSVITDTPVEPTSPEPVDPVEPVPAPTTAPVVSEPVSPVAEPIDALAIGDSVMLGAAPELQELGFTIDATESRSFAEGLDTLTALAEQGRLGDVVVVHLGSNGPISETDIERAATALSTVPTVVFVTNDLPASYTYAATNNELIRGLRDRWPNIIVLDWDDQVDDCPGNCLYDDLIHLRPDGQRYYANLVAGYTGVIGQTSEHPPYTPIADVVPPGFEIVMVQDGASLPPLSSFHGIVHGVGPDGIPTAPIVHLQFVDEPVDRDGERIPVDDVAAGAVYTRWAEQYINLYSPTADVTVPVEDRWIQVSGSDDLELLGEIAATVGVAPDGSVSLVAPDGLVWNPGRWPTIVDSRTVSYLGPGLATLDVSTATLPEGGVFIEALRSYLSPDWFTFIQGMPAVAIDGPRGLGMIQVGISDASLVTLRQSSPFASGDLSVSWPLDPAQMRVLASSLDRLDADEWDRLRNESGSPRVGELLDPGSDSDQPIEAISGTPQIPVTTDAGRDDTSTAYIALVPGSTAPRLVVDRDPFDATSRPIGSQLHATGMLAANAKSTIDPDGAPFAASAVSASVDAGAVWLTNGDVTIAVELVEAFPDLLPGRLIGYVEVAGEGWRLEADHPDAYPITLT
ncbi:MAG: hypothetical protein AAGA42_13075 [Actinomycetota bacterium]